VATVEAEPNEEEEDNEVDRRRRGGRRGRADVQEEDEEDMEDEEKNVEEKEDERVLPLTRHSHAFWRAIPTAAAVAGPRASQLQPWRRTGRASERRVLLADHVWRPTRQPAAVSVRHVFKTPVVVVSGRFTLWLNPWATPDDMQAAGTNLLHTASGTERHGPLPTLYVPPLP